MVWGGKRRTPENEIGDAGAQSLAAALPILTSMRNLHLTRRHQGLPFLNRDKLNGLKIVKYAKCLIWNRFPETLFR